MDIQNINIIYTLVAPTSNIFIFSILLRRQKDYLFSLIDKKHKYVNSFQIGHAGE